MEKRIKRKSSQKTRRVVLAGALAVSLVFGSLVTNGWMSACAEDTLPALGLSHKGDTAAQKLSAKNDGCTVTVSYDAKVTLPEGAELQIQEILPQEDGYTVYKESAAEKLNADNNKDVRIFYERYFDLSISAKDETVNFEEPVTVEFTFDEAQPLTSEQMVGVVRFAKDGAEVLEVQPTFSKDGMETVSFESDSLSACGIVGTEGVNAATSSGDQDSQESKDGEKKETVAENSTTKISPVDKDGTIDQVANDLEEIEGKIDTPTNPMGESVLKMLSTTLLGVSGSADYTIEVGGSIAITGSTANYHWWDSSASSVASVSGDSNQGTVTGVSEGSVTITHTYGDKKDKTHKNNESESFIVTVNATNATPETQVTEEDATALPSQEIEGMPIVSVKETGQLKKISDYHVVIEDKDLDYKDDENFLKAYDIYLADSDNQKVDESELEVNSNSLNLQVSLKYDSLPAWFEQAAQSKNIKHYKNKSDKTELPINNIKFDSANRTISFIVHGFSDFVFIKGSDSNSGTETVTGDGDDFLLSKTATPTGVENEYEISLKVQPRITWGKKTTVNYANLKEVFEASGVWICNSASEMRNGTIDPDLRYADNYNDMKNAVHGGANGARICKTFAESKKTYSSNNPKDWEIKSIKFEEGQVIYLNPSWHVGASSFSNNTMIWILPTGNYFKVNIGSYNNGNINLVLTDTIKSYIQEAAAEYITEEDTGNWNNEGVSIAQPQNVSDPMGTNISFLNFTGIDGNTASGNSASSSYSSASETDGTPDSITWNFSKSLPKGSSASDYEVKSEKYYLKSSCYELKYKIRLDVQNQGFNSTNPITVENDNGVTSWYETNGTTTLTKADGDKQEFEVPEVCGILYDLKFQKVDESGNPIKKEGNITQGAVFEITGSGNDVAKNIIKQAESDADGYVTFEGLPWGTYTIKEKSAPTGYEMESTTTKTVTLCYTTNPDELTTNEDNDTHLMNKNYDELKFTNTKIVPITGLTLNHAAPILGAAAGVVVLAVTLWFIRRRINRFM